MPQRAEQLRQSFHQVCYLPWLDDAPTFEFVDAIKTHENKKNGTDVIGDPYDVLDLPPHQPKGFSASKVLIDSIELVRFCAVHHHAITTD